MSETMMAPALRPRGFSFENCKRNEQLVASTGFRMPKTTKTGTTIVGVIYKDGVILGSDTRATGGNIVSSKNCQKLHYMAKKIYCAGAGTAADCDKVTRMIESQLTIHALNTGREPRICTLSRILKQYLHQYEGHIGCALIVGGVDVTGPHLTSIAPHGSTASLPYATMGSGSLSAVAVLEKQWERNMDVEAAKKLVRNAVAAGVMNDMGSGSNVDLVVINQAGAQLIRPHEVVSKKGERSANYIYKKKTTKILESRIIPFDVEKKSVRIPSQAEPMEM